MKYWGLYVFSFVDFLPNWISCTRNLYLLLNVNSILVNLCNVIQSTWRFILYNLPFTNEYKDVQVMASLMGSYWSEIKKQFQYEAKHIPHWLHLFSNFIQSEIPCKQYNISINPIADRCSSFDLCDLMFSLFHLNFKLVESKYAIARARSQWNRQVLPLMWRLSVETLCLFWGDSLWWEHLKRSMCVDSCYICFDSCFICVDSCFICVDSYYICDPDETDRFCLFWGDSLWWEHLKRSTILQLRSNYSRGETKQKSIIVN